MNRNLREYLTVYGGYFFGYLSYKAIFYALSQICDQVDEIIANDNNNSMPDEIKNILTTHKYKIGKEIVNIIRARGEQGGIVIRPEGVITLAKNVVLLAKVLAETVVINPLSKAIGFIVMKFPAAKKVYTGIKATKVVIASIGALISVRVIARFDY